MLSRKLYFSPTNKTICMWSLNFCNTGRPRPERRQNSELVIGRLKKGVTLTYTNCGLCNSSSAQSKASARYLTLCKEEKKGYFCDFRIWPKRLAAVNVNCRFLGEVCIEPCWETLAKTSYCENSWIADRTILANMWDNRREYFGASLLLMWNYYMSRYLTELLFFNKKIHFSTNLVWPV